MNINFLVGNITKEPEEIKGTSNKLCKLNIAVNENYTKEDGTRPVQFFNVSVWGKLAENCLKYLKKGSKVAVVGKIQNRVWEDDKGEKHYATEVVASEIEFLTSPRTEKMTELSAEEQKKLPF